MKLTHYRPAMSFGNKKKKKEKKRKKKRLEELFSSLLSQFKKLSPLWKSKIIYLGISQNLKLRILMGKILPISVKLNFTPYTLGGSCV